MTNPTARRSRTRRAGAFTLVELLVVIGIIAVLISILLPALSRARKSALNVRCKANERSIYQLMLVYNNEQNEGKFMAAQLMKDGVWWCRWTDRLKDARIVNNFTYMVCPVNPPPSGAGTSSVSYGYRNAKTYLTSDGYLSYKVPGVSSNYPILGDSLSINSSPAYTQWYNLGDSRGYSHAKHQKRTNILFADGHVDGMTAYEISLKTPASIWNYFKTSFVD